MCYPEFMATRFLKLLQGIFNPKEDVINATYRRRLLAEYKNKQPLYEEFGIAMRRLVVPLLQEGNYKYQITHRIKAPERLREKLIRKAAQGTRYTYLDDIEDLVGMRILFYSEGDKEAFVRKIKKGSVGVVRIEERNAGNGYEATHIIMALDPGRLQLSEYKQYDGMKCEVQATTILRHAWAEIQHDLVYKDIFGLKNKNPEAYAYMQQKLNIILEKYIKRASTEFEEITKHIAE